MDFTREPIIESVVTPKEGCKIVVRSSKSAGQEEFFVDAVEVVSFGNSFFFRSLERPKAFLVPVSDYELLEVREARMVLKNVGLDRSIKIGGGKDNKPAKTTQPEKAKPKEAEPEERLEKKRDRRRSYRKRRGRDDIEEETKGNNKIPLPKPKDLGEEKELAAPVSRKPSGISSLLPPPPNLISETLSRYKDDDLFKDVFSEKEQQQEDAQIEEVVSGEEIVAAEEVNVVEDVAASDEVVVDVQETGSKEENPQSSAQTESPLEPEKIQTEPEQQTENLSNDLPEILEEQIQVLSEQVKDEESVSQ